MSTTTSPSLGVTNFKNQLPFGTIVIAHWIPWFGMPNHKNIPNYNSPDIPICDRQCAAMKGLGIDAINVDWYGPKHPFEDLSTRRMLDACERAGLGFSLCLDKGLGAQPADYTDALVYASRLYFPSSAYVKLNGAPLVNFFGEIPGTDFAALKAAFSPTPLFLFQDAGGFQHAASDGAFGWVHPLPNAGDPNLQYVFGFNAAAAANPTKVAWYPVYAGFDDSQASWSQNRKMSRRNGATLIDTLSEVPPTAKYVIVATWNDHEEGSGIEPIPLP